MIKIDLVTGFLGAGKTTFIREYANYLMKTNHNIGIIENDFGAVNVDMMLLLDLDGNQCDVEQIVGGNTCCEWKRRFRTKLIAMAMCGYDRIIVEPSGIYDVDEFFDVLYEEPVSSWYEIGNVFAIVNAKMEQELSEQAQFLLASQVARSGKILLSKVEEASEEEQKEHIVYIQKLLEKYHCKRKIEASVVAKELKEFTEADWEKLLDAGWVQADYEKLWFDQNEAFTSLTFMNAPKGEEGLKYTIKQVMEDQTCGNVFRIKGFTQLEDKSWIEVNATHDRIVTKPIEQGQEVIIVIGNNLVEDAIKPYWE